MKWLIYCLIGVFNIALVNAKTIKFPQPIGYESSGYHWMIKSFAYTEMKKRLGKPLSETGECAWGHIEYPNISFYDIDGTKPREVTFESMRFVSPKDKVIFPSFVINGDTTFADIKKYKPRLLDTQEQKPGVVEYIIDMLATRKYDGYGYSFSFKNGKLVEFSEW